MNSHLDYMIKNPSTYDAVIKESYNRVFNRQPSNEELNYWKGQPKCAFIWLFRAHSQYAMTQRRNNAVSVKGSGFVSVNSTMIAEVRTAAANLIASNGGKLVGMDGGTMVAAGGGNLVGNDGASMVAAGGGN